MNTQNPKTWFNIFRVGRHTARNGETHDYPEQALRTLVAQYDGEKDAAPIVVGHPETHSPAYGWIAEIRLKDGVLQAKARDVQQPFLEAVQAGAYRKISLAMKRLEDGALRILHIGFLGGAAPAIKGLGEVQWSEDDTKTRYEYAYLTESANSECLLAQKMQQAAKLLEDAEYQAFSAQMKAQGIINPLGDTMTRKILLALKESHHCFSDDQPLAEAFQDSLLKLPQTIDFEEYTSEGEEEEAFSQSSSIQDQARAYQTQHPAISWPDAVTHVTSHSKG